MSIVILGGNACMERRYMELCASRGQDVKIERSHTSSLAALREILEKHTAV